MKRSPVSLWNYLWLLLPLAALWLTYEVLLAPTARDLVWQHELVSALDAATTVKVVEHSNIREQFRLGHPPKVYATVTLNEEQIAELRRLFSQVSDETPTFGILKCKFEEHHYIEMVMKDGSTRTMLLCFECGQYYLGDKPDDKWNYSELGKMSDSWKSSISHFIASLGLHPNGPWWGPGSVEQPGS